MAVATEEERGKGGGLLRRRRGTKEVVRESKDGRDGKEEIGLLGPWLVMRRRFFPVAQRGKKKETFLRR